jgi:hypothetical protein
LAYARAGDIIVRDVRILRGVGVIAAGAFAFLLILSALCPLPAFATDQGPAWGDRGVPVECPFHPGRPATLSAALQFSLQHLHGLPADGAPAPDVDGGGRAVVPPPQDPPLSFALLRVSHPQPVPLYLLHVSLIR